MFRHDDERVREKFSRAAIVEDGLLKEFRVGRHLKQAAALCRYRGQQKGYEFLAVPIAPEKHKRVARG
jgi:hypothetical protein